MADRRTEMTELATGLGMLDLPDLDRAVAGRPAELVNVSGEQFDRLAAAVADPRLRAVADAAFANGRAFRHAPDGLRDRPPARIEWKGPHRPPGYELLPADLRIDHVYLVSCKYQSHLLVNAAPAHLFDRLLQVRSGPAAADWYQVVAPDAYRALYEAARAAVDAQLPATMDELTAADRRLLADRLARRWPADVEPAYRHLCQAVSEATARRWAAALPKLRQREELVWRLLRLSDCPYFVLGSSRDGRPLRLRIATPWDWRQRYRLTDLTLSPCPAGQPRVEWEADVLDRQVGDRRPLRGHVEVRWSHGRFSGMPEAKVYLDTPHDQVPGYHPLDPDTTGRSGAGTAVAPALPLWSDGPAGADRPAGVDGAPDPDGPPRAERPW